MLYAAGGVSCVWTTSITSPPAAPARTAAVAVSLAVQLDGEFVDTLWLTARLAEPDSHLPHRFLSRTVNTSHTLAHAITAR